MLFNLTQIEPVLQRQLDADQARWSRLFQLETDARFDEQELKSFHMKGLFGEIPLSESGPMPLHPRT